MIPLWFVSWCLGLSLGIAVMYRTRAASPRADDAAFAIASFVVASLALVNMVVLIALIGGKLF